MQPHSTHSTDEKKAGTSPGTAITTPTTTTNPEDRNKGESETKPYAYPRYVFKQGTGRLVDEENNRYEAETRLVHDEEEFRRLGDGWRNTPKEATQSVNVTNANANVTYNEDGTVAVVPHATEGRQDRSGDMQRRTLIDADEQPKPRLDKGDKSEKEKR